MNSAAVGGILFQKLPPQQSSCDTYVCAKRSDAVLCLDTPELFAERLSKEMEEEHV